MSPPKHAKRHAGILSVGEIQESGDHGHIALETELSRSPRFRGLIDHEDAARYKEIRQFPENVFFVQN